MQPPRRGRPRDPQIDAAILAAAERELEERGYTGMALESVAAAAGTTAPSLRRRYRDKAELAAAVVDSLRIEPLSDSAGAPRDRALAILENFRRNLERPRTMALLGTLLAEEHRTPQLLERFRSRLVGPRRAMLRGAVVDAIGARELPAKADAEVIVNMLIGSFYARLIAGAQVPKDWPQRVVDLIWGSRRR